MAESVSGSISNAGWPWLLLNKHFTIQSEKARPLVQRNGAQLQSTFQLRKRALHSAGTMSVPFFFLFDLVRLLLDLTFGRGGIKCFS
jgi:hypothetical protein